MTRYFIRPFPLYNCQYNSLKALICSTCTFWFVRFEEEGSRVSEKRTLCTLVKMEISMDAPLHVCSGLHYLQSCCGVFLCTWIHEVSCYTITYFLQQSNNWVPKRLFIWTIKSITKCLWDQVCENILISWQQEWIRFGHLHVYFSVKVRHTHV